MKMKEPKMKAGKAPKAKLMKMRKTGGAKAKKEADSEKAPKVKKPAKSSPETSDDSLEYLTEKLKGEQL